MHTGNEEKGDKPCCVEVMNHFANKQAELSDYKQLVSVHTAKQIMGRLLSSNLLPRFSVLCIE